MLGLASLLRLASISICLIVIVSFAVFAVDQTSNASHHQQQVLDENSPVAPGSSPSGAAAAPAQSSAPGSAPASPSASASSATATHSTSSGENGLHKALDDVSNKLTSPFSSVVSGDSSEWAVRGVKLLLTLVVYGFGLGYIARVIRVRV